MLSTEAGRIAVASGVINDISQSHVSVKKPFLFLGYLNFVIL